MLGHKEKGSALSYLQLVEVAFVASFRKAGLTLRKIREARQYLAQRFQEEYPFASLKLCTDGAHILLDFDTQGKGQAFGNKLIVADKKGQLAWRAVIADRLQQFEYEEGIALRWHPRGKKVPIVVDPRVGFGAPIINDTNIATWAVKGRFESGETIEEIAEDLEIGERLVAVALKFEGVELSQAA